MTSSPFISGNTSTNISDLESWRAPFLTPPTKRTRRPERVHRVHYEDSHSSTSNREEFIQDIIIENLPIEEEEDSHRTGRSMNISGSIQADSVLSEPLLIATNKSYFSKSTGRTKANVLADKVISPKDIRGIPGTHQHGTDSSGATKSLPLMFGSANLFCWQLDWWIWHCKREKICVYSWDVCWKHA